MGLIELFILAAGLSVDSFAVSVCTGLTNRRLFFFQALKIAFVFGFIQGMAPVLGGLLGMELRDLLQNMDHWVALILLSLVGFKMIRDGWGQRSQIPKGQSTGWRRLMLMGVATSIDAAVVGITLGLVNVSVWRAGLIIGMITVLASLTGLFLGSRFSGFSRMKLELASGVVLIGLGLKIFIEHQIHQI